MSSSSSLRRGNTYKPRLRNQEAQASRQKAPPSPHWGDPVRPTHVDSKFINCFVFSWLIAHVTHTATAHMVTVLSLAMLSRLLSPSSRRCAKLAGVQLTHRGLVVRPQLVADINRSTRWIMTPQHADILSSGLKQCPWVSHVRICVSQCHTIIWHAYRAKISPPDMMVMELIYILSHLLYFYCMLPIYFCCVTVVICTIEYNMPSYCAFTTAADVSSD